MADRSVTPRTSRRAVIGLAIAGVAGVAAATAGITHLVLRSRASRALFAALRARDADAVERLLADGADASATEGEARLTPLILAASFGDERSVALLIRHGANVHARDWLGQTALFDAVLDGRLGTARQLLDAGAEVDAVDDDGVTPLFFAAHKGHLEERAAAR